MVEMNKKIHILQEDNLPQFLDMNLEIKFTGKQRIVRRELFEFLMGKTSDGKDKIELDQIIIRCCPKISQGLGEYFPQNSELYRGTNFRGVSRNGRCNWQILTMVDGQKVYLGTVDNILKAAILYDLVSIQAKGLKAKTNFIYTKKELIAILFLKSLMMIKFSGIENRKVLGQNISEERGSAFPGKK